MINAAASSLLVQLTPRQTAILKLAAHGYTEKESATLLKLSYKTIKFHKTRMFKTLQVKSIVQAVVLLERDTALPAGGKVSVVAEVVAAIVAIAPPALTLSEYSDEVLRLNYLVQVLTTEMEHHRTKASEYRSELEKIQTGKRSEFKLLPSSSVGAFAAKISGVPK